MLRLRHAYAKYYCKALSVTPPTSLAPASGVVLVSAPSSSAMATRSAAFPSANRSASPPNVASREARFSTDGGVPPPFPTALADDESLPQKLVRVAADTALSYFQARADGDRALTDGQAELRRAKVASRTARAEAKKRKAARFKEANRRAAGLQLMPAWRDSGAAMWTEDALPNLPPTPAHVSQRLPKTDDTSPLAMLLRATALNFGRLSLQLKRWDALDNDGMIVSAATRPPWRDCVPNHLTAGSMAVLHLHGHNPTTAQPQHADG